MNEIGVRELRNDVSEVLRRAEAGENFVVTVRGRPVARVSNLDSTPTKMPKETFFAALGRVAADAALLGDVADASGGTIEEITPWSD